MRLESFIRACIYALTLTPLIFWRPLMFFFEQTKGFYVIFIAEVLLLLFGWLCYARPSLRLRLGSIGVALVVYIAVLFLTSVLGVDFSVSFWGEADRVTALFYWIHLAIVFVVLVNVLRTKDDWIGFLRFSVVIALVVAFIQLMFVLGVSEIPDSRNGATLGNSTYLAVYLLFHVFFALFIAVSSHTRFLKRFGYASAAVLAAVVILPGDANAAILSLYGALVLLGALSLAWGSRVRWRRVVGWSLLGVLVVIVTLSSVMLAQPDSALREYAVSLSSEARFVIWDIAWQGIKERPVFGWGLENFPRVFFDHYNPCLGAPPCGGEMFFDRAHNKVLDVWIESGLVGLVAYIVLLVVAALALFRLSREKEKAFSAAVLLALLAAYFVQNLTILDVSITLLFFVITLALIQSLSFPPIEVTFRVVPQSRPILAVLATGTFLLGTFFFVVSPVRASLAVASLDTVSTPQERARLFDQAANGSRFGERTRRSYIAYRTLSWLEKNGRLAVQTHPEYILQEIRRAQQPLLDQLERTDFDPRLYTLLGGFSQIEGRLFASTGYEQARQIFEQGMARHPLNPKPAWAAASLYLELGDFESATRVIQTVVEYAPLLGEARYNQLVVEKFVSDPAIFALAAQETAKAFPALATKIDHLVSLDLESDRDALLYLIGRF